MTRFTVKVDNEVTKFDNYNEAIENLDKALVKSVTDKTTKNLELVYNEKYTILEIKTRFGMITKYYTKG